MKRFLYLLFVMFLLIPLPANANLTMTAGEGIDITSAGAGLDVTVAGEDATTANKGIASFNSSHFSVSSGAVSMQDIYIINSGDTGTGAYDFGGATVEIPNSTSLPGTCTVGEIYMDTDATSGQRIYACESTNTWALQGDGGAGGGSGAFSDSSDPVVLNTTTKDVNIGTTHNNSAKLSIDGDADQIQLSVQGNSTQTSNLIVAENSAGTDVFVVTNGGTVTANQFTSSGSGISVFNNSKNSTNDVIIHGDTTDNILLADVSADSIIGTGTWDLSSADVVINSGTDPTTKEPCEAGEMFIDTDASSGGQWMVCESGSFVVQGAAGLGDITAVGSGSTGDVFSDGDNDTLTFEGTTADTFEAVLQGSGDPTEDVTVSIQLPTNRNTTIMGMDSTGSLTLVFGQSYSNLVVTGTLTTATVTADYLGLVDTNGVGFIAKNVNETATITTSGVNGLDTGAEGSSTWYSVWIISKEDGTVDSLLSASSTLSTITLPSGYVYGKRVGWVYNDASSDIEESLQVNNYVQTLNRTSVLTTGSATTFTNVDLSSAIPSTSMKVAIEAFQGTVNKAIFIRPDGFFGDGISVYEQAGTYTTQVISTTSSSQIIEYKTGASGSVNLNVVAYWDNL